MLWIFCNHHVYLMVQFTVLKLLPSEQLTCLPSLLISRDILLILEKKNPNSMFCHSHPLGYGTNSVTSLEPLSSSWPFFVTKKPLGESTIHMASLKSSYERFPKSSAWSHQYITVVFKNSLPSVGKEIEIKKREWRWVSKLFSKTHA